MEAAIEAGANMLEADFVADNDGSVFVEHDFINPTSTRFEDWAAALNVLAADNNGVAGIVFDIKAPRPEDVSAVVRAAREHLDRRLKRIYSTAKLGDARRGCFDEMLKDIEPNEGISIDCSDADPVHEFFMGKQTDEFSRFWYGNGRTSLLPEPRKVGQNLERALSLRDSRELCKKVYAWTYSNKDSMKKYLELGVDGLIVDHMEGFKHTEIGVKKAMEAIIEINEGRPGALRLADRSDAEWGVYSDADQARTSRKGVVSSRSPEIFAPGP